MNRKFHNMDELKEYLAELEARVERAEKSQFSENFLVRCFQIWGHYLVANLIMGTIMGIIGVIIYVAFAGAIMGVFLGNSNRRNNDSTPPIIVETPNTSGLEEENYSFCGSAGLPECTPTPEP